MTGARTLSNGWPDALQAALGNSRWVVHPLASCPSTQDVARDAALHTVVITAHQTAGRGRLGRTWVEPAGVNVAMTVVLPVMATARLSLIGALAVANAINAMEAIDAPPRVRVKWPNDVMLDGRKVAGVLIETVVDGTNARALLGIGINVGRRTWPPELVTTAVALAEAGLDMTPLSVATRTLEALETLLDAADTDLVARFRALDAVSGTRRTVTSGERTVIGTVLDIDPFVALRMRLDDGQTVQVPVAHARLVHA